MRDDDQRESLILSVLLMAIFIALAIAL